MCDQYPANRAIHCRVVHVFFATGGNILPGTLTYSRGNNIEFESFIYINAIKN